MPSPRPPAAVAKGIMAVVNKHLKWVPDPVDPKTGNLLPNIAYSTGKKGTKGKYHYTTDAKGRIASAHARPLTLEKIKRARHNPNTPGKLPGDHAGHLIADMFGGSPQLDNLVSQASDVNLSRFRTVENDWARRLDAGEDVQVDVLLDYGEGGRPTGFTILQTFNGVPQPPLNVPNI